jgi:hypothetical protein
MAVTATARELSPQLDAIRKQLDACSARATSMVESFTPEKLKQRPANGGWSATECVAHLTLSAGEFFDKDLLDLSGLPSSTEDYKADFKGRMLAWFLEPPYRMKAKALDSTTPVNADPNKILPDFLAIQARLQSKLAECHGVAIDQKKIASPFNEKIAYNIYSFFLITCAHERRHLWQAEQVIKNL